MTLPTGAIMPYPILEFDETREAFIELSKGNSKDE